MFAVAGNPSNSQERRVLRPAAQEHASTSPLPMRLTPGMSKREERLIALACELGYCCIPTHQLVKELSLQILKRMRHRTEANPYQSVDFHLPTFPLIVAKTILPEELLREQSTTSRTWALDTPAQGASVFAPLMSTHAREHQMTGRASKGLRSASQQWIRVCWPPLLQRKSDGQPWPQEQIDCTSTSSMFSRTRWGRSVSPRTPTGERYQCLHRCCRAFGKEFSRGCWHHDDEERSALCRLARPTFSTSEGGRAHIDAVPRTHGGRLSASRNLASTCPPAERRGRADHSLGVLPNAQFPHRKRSPRWVLALCCADGHRCTRFPTPWVTPS